MSGLWGSMDIALGALQVDQAGVNVASNNIANINTPGYTREELDVSENAPITVGQQVFGTGVSLDSIQSVRDNVLELQVANETQEESQSDAYLGPMEEVESMFNDADGTGLQSDLSAFFNSFTQLSTDPTSVTYRQDVLTAAQNLASDFNQDSSSLSAIQSDLDQQVTADVSEVNDITTQIAQLNQQISQVPSGQSGADSLVDQQTALVQQLAGLVGVNVTDNDNGTINVSTTNGSALVAGSQSFALTTSVNASTGHEDVYDSQGTDITSTLSGGDLAGTIQARDQGIAGVMSQLDTMAADISNEVNTANENGLDLNGNPGSAIFTTPPASGSGAAAQMAVASTATTSTIAAASSSGTFSAGDNTNALALANLQNQTIVDGDTPVDYYSNFVSELGNDVSGATTQNTAQQQVLDQLQDQLNSVSGVSLDEEAVSLIQYQQAYEASARVISVVQELSNDAINIGNSSGG